MFAVLGVPNLYIKIALICPTKTRVFIQFSRHCISRNQQQAPILKSLPELPIIDWQVHQHQRGAHAAHSPTVGSHISRPTAKLDIEQATSTQDCSSVGTGRKCMVPAFTHPTAEESLDPAAAGQTFAWIDGQQSQAAGPRPQLRMPLRLVLTPWSALMLAEQKTAGDVKHPGTCASSGRGCLGPGTAAAREVTLCSALANIICVGNKTDTDVNFEHVQ